MITLQFIPYKELEGLSSEKRINKIIKAVKSEKIVLIEGSLESKEETNLISKTMEQINEDFTGIEISVVKSDSLEEKFLDRMRSKLVRFLTGNRYGFTIIGPAKIVKEIKQDPGKVQLLTNIPSKKK